MLMQQLLDWARQIYVLIGILLASAVGLILLIVAWTGLKIVLQVYRQHRGKREYVKRFYRADGRKYPPYIEGICEGCGRGHRTVYHPQDGPNLCPDCYEPYWRRVTGWSEDDGSDAQ